MTWTVRELAEMIAYEINKKYELTRKVRAGDNAKLSLADIIEKKIESVIDL